MFETGGRHQKREGLYLHLTAVVDDAYVLDEFGSLRVAIQGGLVLPCLAYHEYIGACGAFKYVIGTAALVAQALGRKGNGCLESLVVAALGCLEKAVES